ncbi:lrrc15 [Pungitius sinensis]
MHQYRKSVEGCKSQMMIYTALLLVMVVCTLLLARFTLSLYSLLQHRERTNHWVKLTRFSFRREVTFRPLQEAETVGL